MRLVCSFCGERNIGEFSYMGNASLVRPAADAGQQAYVEHVYMRDNVSGPQSEYWYHTASCRQVIKVVRDTRTHAILSVPDV